MPRVPGGDHLHAVRALRKVGFEIIREERHFIMSDGQRRVVIPRHIPINALTTGGIARCGGLSVDEFRRLL